MTEEIPQPQNITAIIDQALDACKALDPDAIVRVSNRQVMEWLREHRKDIVKHDGQMANEHWIKLIGDRRKARAPRLEERHSSQICLDLGLPELNLDAELSIPRDPKEPLGGCYWKEADDAKLKEVSLHIHLLNAQSAAVRRKAKDWRSVYQAGVHHAGGDLEKTISEVRAIARQQKERGAA